MSLDNVLQKQHISIVMVYDILFKVAIFGDKVKSTRQISLRTIINTKIHAILEILPNSFEMSKRILKYYNGVYMVAKVFLALLLRKRTITPNKKSSRKENKRVSSKAMISL